MKGKVGYKGAIKPWSADNIKDHLISLGEFTVKPKDCTTQGYLFQGSIRCDGLEIQLIA
jgi:hypothetical protein